MSQFPLTRWELSDHSGYAQRFARLIENGEDIDAEARLADVLTPRGADILDAGSGMGRVAAGIARRGHRVVGVEKDPTLITDSAARFPDLPVVHSDILGLTPRLLTDLGHPPSYDLITVVGNVMILVAEETEHQVLRTLGALLKPEGRILLGFSLVGGPADSHDYPWAEFTEDVSAAGLKVQHRFGTYELSPPSEEFAVTVLTGRR